jgi:hypothetical protein
MRYFHRLVGSMGGDGRTLVAGSKSILDFQISLSPLPCSVSAPGSGILRVGGLLRPDTPVGADGRWISDSPGSGNVEQVEDEADER